MTDLLHFTTDDTPALVHVSKLTLCGRTEYFTVQVWIVRKWNYDASATPWPSLNQQPQVCPTCHAILRVTS